MGLIKKTQSAPHDQDWFTFSMGLSQHLWSDYLQMKLCYMMEPLTLCCSNFVNMVEVVEKSFKVYLAMKEKRENTLSYFSDTYRHNIEKMRTAAATHNSVFDSPDIKSFTKPFDDGGGQLYQQLRYGSQRKLDGFKTRLSTLLPAVEKIFYTCTQDHDDGMVKMLNNSSTLFFIITNNDFAQAQNREILLNAIQYRNDHYADFETHCMKIKEENDRTMQQLIMNNKDA